MSAVKLLPFGLLQLDLSETAAELCCLFPCAVTAVGLLSCWVPIRRRASRAAGRRKQRLPAPYVHAHGDTATQEPRCRLRSICRAGHSGYLVRLFGSKSCRDLYWIILVLRSDTADCLEPGAQHAAPLCQEPHIWKLAAKQIWTEGTPCSYSRPPQNTWPKELHPGMQTVCLRVEFRACSAPRGRQDRLARGHVQGA